MISALCLSLAFGLAATGPAQSLKHADAELIQTVEAALDRAPEALNNHRGFLALLRRNQAIARAEDAWLDLNLLIEFHALAQAADEALHDAPNEELLFDRFYDQLVRDPKLRESVESLQRTELERAPKAEHAEQPLSTALDFLRANPDAAMTFLRDPAQAKPLPHALDPYLDYFKSRPELLSKLLETFQGITDNPLAQSNLLPWWQAASALKDGAFGRFTKHLLAHPKRYWVWHTWNLTLAEDAHTRTWIRYWFRQARRTPGLEQNYERYLDLMRKFPQYAARAEAHWQENAGPAPEWPPKTDPPLLTIWTAPDMPPALVPKMPAYAPAEKPDGTRPAKQDRPEVRRPEMPKKPEVPTMKTSPRKRETPDDGN